MFLLHFNAQITYMTFLRFQKLFKMNFSCHFQQFYQIIDVYENKMTMLNAVRHFLINCCHSDLLIFKLN